MYNNTNNKNKKTDIKPFEIRDIRGDGWELAV